MVRARALISVALTVALSACGHHNDTNDAPESQNAPGQIVGNAPLADVAPVLQEAASAARLLTYRSRSGVDDGYTSVTATVFVPKREPPPGGYGVVAVGHPNTGTAADCAPSLSPTLLDLSELVGTLLNAGYVVTVPDGQGLGHPSDNSSVYHPYLDSITAGYDMIDAVRAVRTAVPQMSANWAALGIDQGGQAAWAANELGDNYGWGMNLVGTISVDPTADVIGLADAAAAGTLTPQQSVSLVRFLAALKNAYGDDINLDDYRRGVAEQNWDLLQSCQAQTAAQRTEVAQRIAPEDLRPATPAAANALRMYLKKTNLPQGPTIAPMRVLYGGTNALTSAEWTTRALRRACQMGDVISIDLQADTDRAQLDPAQTLSWIDDRFNSVAPPNDCGSLAEGDEHAGAGER